MLITVKVARTAPLPSGAELQIPAGWSGEVDDALALAWIADGSAEPEYTEGQVLAHLAQGMIAEQKAADAVEIAKMRDATPPPVTDSGDPVSYADLTIPELLAFAAAVGLDTAPLGRRPKKAELVAALEAHEQAVSGGEPA